MELVFDRLDRVFHPNEIITGNILMHAHNPFPYTTLSMKIEGSVKLQLSAKSVGLFEAYYNSIAPVELVHYQIPIKENERATVGTNTFPFSFKLQGIDGRVRYNMDMRR